MTIIHFADLHLSQDRPERLEILQWIFNAAAGEKADIIIIAGDLFDSDKESTLLRAKVKSLIEAINIPVLISSGNHDTKSFGQHTDFGKNAIIFCETPFHVTEISSVRFAAIPFQDKLFSDCIKNLPENIDILIAHGTLYDPDFIYSIIEDDYTAYMPILPSNLSGIARYVALGHLHNKHRSFQYDNTICVYPGSAAATDTKCTGPRMIYKINIEAAMIRFEPIEIKIAAYYKTKEFFLFPDNQDQIIRNIITYLKPINDKRIMHTITVNGFTTFNEVEFNEQIKKTEKSLNSQYPGIKINLNIQDWHLIASNNLVQRFVDKTAGIDPAMRKKMYELAFPVFYDLSK